MNELNDPIAALAKPNDVSNAFVPTVSCWKFRLPNESLPVACSALKRSYRARLRVDERVIFVHLALSQALIERRLKQRQDHFMNPALAESQFETLEPPQSGLTLNASLPPAVLVEQVRKALGL